MYGWDSYFIIRGLLEGDHERDLARGMVENFFFEIEHYGAVLNANRTYYLTRSQPPFLASDDPRDVWRPTSPRARAEATWLDSGYAYRRPRPRAVDAPSASAPEHRVGALLRLRRRDRCRRWRINPDYSERDSLAGGTIPMTLKTDLVIARPGSGQANRAELLGQRCCDQRSASGVRAAHIG